MTIAKHVLAALVLITPVTTHGGQSFPLCRSLVQQGEYALAAAPCTKAAEEGSLDAQNWLGLMYTKGKGVAQDYRQALKWKKMAAMQGDPVAEFTYGRMFEQGLGVRKDPAKAMAWYRKAAAQGNIDAWYSIGSLYLKGEGTAKDPVQALAWYTLAADQGMYLAEEAKEKLEKTLTNEQQRRAAKLAHRLGREPTDKKPAR
jgi:TPR repeat protein